MNAGQRRGRGALWRAVPLWAVPLWGLSIAVLAVGACAPPKPHWNVLVVTFDTTRADHIGAYGYQAARTPVVDRLAEEGVLFEQAIAPVPITLPSHSSLMTGKAPLAHGVRDNGLFALGEEQTTLAEILRDVGYRTAAAIGSFPLTAEFGLDQGFELFDDHLTSPYEDYYGQRVLPRERLFFEERRAARVNEAILPWLEEHADERFFIWLHYFDPHHPHEPPAPYDQLFAHRLYDGEIAYSDESLGSVLEHLERLGVADNTLVVFTSDHGEGRGEHDESTHSMLAYQSTLHVPLVIKVPDGQQGIRVSERVSTMDVVPTVLDLLGLEAPAGLQGLSLRSVIEGGEASWRSTRPIYAETLSPRLSRGWGELRALVADGKKYIHGPRPELFDLDLDPRELDDLFAEQPELAERMRGRLASYLVEHAASGLDASVPLDDEARRKLEALGYLQGSGERAGAIDERLRQDGDPPQDHAATTTVFSQARNLLFEGRALEAQGFIQELLRTDPENPFYLELLAQSKIRAGDSDGALEILRQLAALDGGYPPREKLLRLEASVLFMQGEPKRAYVKTDEAERLAPTADGQYRLALYAQQAGQERDATYYFEAALLLDPDFSPALVDLGIRRAIEGDLAQAEALLERALAADPFFARTHYNYAALLVQTDRLARAAAHFERAFQLRPDYLQARAARVEVLIDLGQLDEARAEAATLERRSPGSAESRNAQQLIAAAS
ncbi:MAG: sulfatase-like hydrolase/transferase [Acidobacteriota bacterium]